MVSLEARVLLAEHVFHCGGDYTEEVKQKFAEMIPEPHVIHRKTVRKFIDNFGENGSVADEPRSCRPRVSTEVKVLNISERLTQNPKKSIRKLSQQAGVLHPSSQTALQKELHLYPYR
jgi:transposase